MKINPVLCIHREALLDQGLHLFKSLNTSYEFDFNKVESKHIHLLHRYLADSKKVDDSDIAEMLPQVLPYATVRCGDEYLSYSRAKGQETRLHGSLSIGFGGHIDLSDIIQNYLNLEFSLERELDEELGLDPDLCVLTNPNQVLVDTTNAVGCVHVGIVYNVEIPSKHCISADPAEIHLPEWVTKEQLLAEIDSYENWSQTLIKQL